MQLVKHQDLAEVGFTDTTLLKEHSWAGAYLAVDRSGELSWTLCDSAKLGTKLKPW